MQTTYEIHPAIGIARVGNSARPDAYFVGPEPALSDKAYTDGIALPGIARSPTRSTFRDASGALLRQAVRFRVFRIVKDDQGKVVKKEAVPHDTPIEWNVRLANRKGVAQCFEGPPGKLRNDGDPLCIIDSGLKRISKAAPPLELAGEFRQHKVTLGEAWERKGWLYVLGGFGKADMRTSSTADTESVPGELNYADNDHWYDDTSDGPVYARVKENGTWQTASPAWTIVAPPDFAPEIDSFITLYDVARQAAIDMGAHNYPAHGTTVFFRDVLPILDRVRRYRWVNGPSIRAETQDRHARWASPQLIEALANHNDTADGRKGRRMMWAHLPVPPDLPNPLPTDYVLPERDDRQLYMPRLYGHAGEGKNEVLPLLPFQYLHMLNWHSEDFVRDQPPEKEFPCDALDRIALEACSGGAFFPGIEAPRIMRDSAVYAAPFRLKPAGGFDPDSGNSPAPVQQAPLRQARAADFPGLVAGQVTEGLAVPWQADFFYCQQMRDSAWWPASRPDDVFHKDKPPPVVVDSLSDWTVRWDDNVDNARDMVRKWNLLGIVRRIQAVPEPGTAISEMEARAYDVEVSASGIKSYFYYGETDRRLRDSVKRKAHFPKPHGS